MKEYLTATYAEKEKVKALGARFDSDVKKWFVPEGLDLAPFRVWLPAASGQTAPVAAERPIAAGVARFPMRLNQENAVSKKGISLSQLLAGVTRAIAQTFGAGVWTTVEVVSARAHSNGNVYLEISESDVSGSVIAKSGAVIWASNANRILPEFEKATGAMVGPGIKLLVRAKPGFKAL